MDLGFDPACPVLCELRDLLQRGPRPLALVGAGVSINSGYPSWPRLLALFDANLDQTTSPKWRQALKDLPDPLWQAEEYREAMGASRFEDLIARTFAGRTPAEPHLTLARLPFRHFLTTNYDPCIEAAIELQGGPRPPWFCWDEAPRLTAFLRELSNPDAPRTVLYLHGRYHAPSRIIFTESGYAERYVDSEDARRKLLAVFLTCPVVFIGFSMDDPDLAQLMREVASRAGDGAAHYAILGHRTEDERQAIARRMQGKFGVRVTSYQVTGDDHSGLARLLSWLESELVTSGAIPASPDPAAVSSAPKPGSQLEGSSGDKAGAVGADLAASAEPEVRLVDPIDPHKGQFGGAAAANGFLMEAQEVSRYQRSYLELIFRVRSTKPDRPLEGRVIFHLHPSFGRSVVHITAKRGVAELERLAYGAFTIGAEIEATGTRLELDLAALPNLPSWFRSR